MTDYRPSVKAVLIRALIVSAEFHVNHQLFHGRTVTSCWTVHCVLTLRWVSEQHQTLSLAMSLYLISNKIGICYSIAGRRLAGHDTCIAMLMTIGMLIHRLVIPWRHRRRWSLGIARRHQLLLHWRRNSRWQLLWGTCTVAWDRHLPMIRASCKAPS